jgi:hypothetical protein
MYLTAIGLTPGGRSTSHIYTQTIQKYRERRIWEVWAMPRLCELYPGICLQLRKKHGKTSVRVYIYIYIYRERERERSRISYDIQTPMRTNRVISINTDVPP